MDILASMKCISVSRLLGFALISLPRKFIICLSVPDSCTVFFKGINYDSLLVKAGLFANRPARTVHIWNHCTHLRLFCLTFWSRKHTHHSILAISSMRETLNRCIKTLETLMGTFQNQFFSPLSKRYEPFLSVILSAIFLLCLVRFTLLWSVHIELNSCESDAGPCKDILKGRCSCNKKGTLLVIIYEIKSSYSSTSY